MRSDTADAATVWRRAVAAAKHVLARRRKDERVRIPPRPFIRNPDGEAFDKMPPVMRDNEGDELCEPYAELGRRLASR